MPSFMQVLRKIQQHTAHAVPNELTAGSDSKLVRKSLPGMDLLEISVRHSTNHEDDSSAMRAEAFTLGNQLLPLGRHQPFSWHRTHLRFVLEFRRYSQPTRGNHPELWIDRVLDSNRGYKVCQFSTHYDDCPHADTLQKD